MPKYVLLEIVYWGFLVIAFFFVRGALRSLAKGRPWRFFIYGILGGLLIWARFVEPQQIIVQEHIVEAPYDVKVALITDLHLGVYKDRRFLQRVINTINRRKDIDYLLIGGDLTYEPKKSQRLSELFEPLGDSTVPVFMVLGNHDVEKPGPELREELIDAVTSHGVMFLHNDIIELKEGPYLVGLGPHLSGEDDVGLLDELSGDEYIIVLTHNPDTVDTYTNPNADVTLVGHTHCGQLRPPVFYYFLKQYILPVKGDFDCGRTDEYLTKLFISRGLGEVLLPVRFFAPPTIDLIHFYSG